MAGATGLRHSFRLGAFIVALAFAAAGCGGSPTNPSSNLRITSISPSRGTTFGGDTVTVTGQGFQSSTQIRIGDTAATTVVVQSDSALTFVTPAHEAGTVDVTATVGKDSSALKSAFTYDRQTVTNSAPVVQSLDARGSRANEPAGYAAINEAITLNASVTDDVTPVANLTYQWSVSAGTIQGTGSRVTFVAPSAAATARITLTVVEKYRTPDAKGLPVDAENTVSATVNVMVHDELGEIGDMAVDFLRLFSISSVAPADVVHNFRDNCGANGTGKQDELAQIVNNRRNFVILPDWLVGSARSTVSFNGVSPFRARRADGWAAVDVRWHSQCRVKDESIGCASVGAEQTNSGVDWVTAIFDRDANRWWLCDSDYNGTGALKFIK